MKKKLRICIIIAMTLIACVSVFSGCKTDDELAKEIEAKLIISEDGNFGYHIVKGFHGDKYAAFVRLTDEGKEKIIETRKMYLPPFVGGYPLKQAGVQWWADVGGAMSYPTNVPVKEDILVILPYTCENTVNLSGSSNYQKTFSDYRIPPVFDNQPETEKDEYVLYFFNYKGAPNSEYFLVDKLKEGETLGKIPYNPEREGYEFAGWSWDVDGKQMLRSDEIKNEFSVALIAHWKKK